MKSVIFGAGVNAQKTIKLLGKENISYIVDNDIKKDGIKIDEIPVYYFEKKKDEILKYHIVISVSQKYVQEIIQQLITEGVTSFETIFDIQKRITRRKIETRTDYLKIYHKAIEWIKLNSIKDKGIICNTDLTLPYPEVSGYYIPTLLNYGYRDLALQYAKWLCSIQKEDGSWYDTTDTAPYVFDTAQILKGLIAIRDILPKVDENICRGCDWILSNMQDSGRITTPDMSAWGTERTCSEIIHLYCLSPLKEAGKILERHDYIDAAYKILNYYKNQKNDEIMNFGLLSHFYAYVMEALVDMGEIETATEAMGKIQELQDEKGMVPAYKDVNWVCSTGLFQFALVWYRLGNVVCGNKAFEYACKLQNESGGWYGSYLTEKSKDEDNDYFPVSEISWAVKYFLDALYYKNITEFNLDASNFLDHIDKNDGRYICIKEAVHTNKSLKILDVGCGKGRYLKNLVIDEPQNQYFAIDISESVMSEIEGISKSFGTLTNIPFKENYFDIVYTCEALEHAIDIKSAIREMIRVTKPNGKIIIVDKNKDMLGILEIEDWEQWFDVKELSEIIKEYCNEVQVEENISYGEKKDGLFCAWIGKKKVFNQEC